MTSPSGDGRRDAILFDLDGTLIDSIELIVKSAHFAFAKCGLAVPTEKEWLTGVGRPLPVMFRHFSSGSDEDVAALILAYREFQMAHHDALVHAYPGVPELLEELARRGHPLGIVTSKSDALAARGLSHTGIDQFFDTVVGMDSCQRHKPHPEPVMIALDRLGALPERAWFVGDSIHDMESGNAAGVATIGALWGPFTAEDLAPSRPRHLAAGVEDVLTLVDGKREEGRGNR
jgi:pyrophosphatase PpaX